MDSWEPIIQSRLAQDDQKLLKHLYQTHCDLLKSPQVTESQVRALESQLQGLQSLASRAILASRTSELEIEALVQEGARVGQDIDGMQEEIERLRIQLAESKQRRKERVERDRLAQLVLAEPSRSELTTEIAEVKGKMQEIIRSSGLHGIARAERARILGGMRDLRQAYHQVMTQELEKITREDHVIDEVPTTPREDEEEEGEGSGPEDEREGRRRHEEEEEDEREERRSSMSQGSGEEEEEDGEMPVPPQVNEGDTTMDEVSLVTTHTERREEEEEMEDPEGPEIGA
ncbi:MAG: hypothetical protein DHS80DRAFT_30196 [Piptocephalis tieghemiana]|nr:MAG: hypothetical protein DHS80DRAFT_30196 [Piptocephalis tieghemiana]